MHQGWLADAAREKVTGEKTALFADRPWRPFTFLLLGLPLLLFGISGCDGDPSREEPATGLPPAPTAFVVNTHWDFADSADLLSLRVALSEVPDGGTITFDPRLNGATIDLHRIDNEHSVLKGEVFEGSAFGGYQDRDYGPSALYARKSVTIDASSLPDGIALNWTGGAERPARVLAVYGDLELRNVSISGGHAKALPRYDDPAQPYTLARGGGLAVWGRAVLRDCTISGNTVEGDHLPGRDRGAFGGGIYADRIDIEDCVISGNRASGFGAAGGGVYSVGGVNESSGRSVLRRTTVSGNRAEGQHAYGGGVYSDGGGRGNSGLLLIESATIARNLVTDHPEIPEDERFQYYFRGGGVYMSNGYLALIASTVAENAVQGPAQPFRGHPNVGGGGLGATIGDAHVVENMWLRHSIVVGNTVNNDPEDVFTGSLIHFFSDGYNLVGRIDFSQILVPVPRWYSLNRKHWPAEGDGSGVGAQEVLLLDAPARHGSIVSVGTDAGDRALLWYPVHGEALNRIPAEGYTVRQLLAEAWNQTDQQVLYGVLDALQSNEDHAGRLEEGFYERMLPLAEARFHGPPSTWPRNPDNAPWITFWGTLDQEVGERLGMAGLGGAFWRELIAQAPDEHFRTHSLARFISLSALDQQQRLRPYGSRGDVGAVEMGSGR